MAQEPAPAVPAPAPSAASDVAKVPTSPDLSPAAIVKANTLQVEGGLPFHLKMNFQVSDLKGKPGEQGTIEYWWAGPEGSHLDISAPSLGTVHNTGLDELSGPEARRTLYLATQLLHTTCYPGSSLGLPKAQVESEERVIGSTVLECMHQVPSSPPPSGPVQPVIASQVCADAQTGTIRFLQTPQYDIVRNRVANFGKTRVALDTTIEYASVVSIKGQVTELKSFHPAGTTTVDLEKPKPPEETKASSPGTIRLAGGVIAGRKTGGNTPDYPYSARQMGLSGTVVLMAEITKQGTVSNLFPVASPDPSLTQSAIAAVSKWTYKPYLLNGEPVSVSTTITVNFNLNQRY